jgi:hypothetical protein
VRNDRRGDQTQRIFLAGREFTQARDIWMQQVEAETHRREPDAERVRDAAERYQSFGSVRVDLAERSLRRSKRSCLFLRIEACGAQGFAVPFLGRYLASWRYDLASSATIATDSTMAATCCSPSLDK